MAHTAWQMASTAHCTYSSHPSHPKSAHEHDRSPQSKEAEARGQANNDHDAEAGFTKVPLERLRSTASEAPLLPSSVGQSLADRFAGVGKGLSTWGFGKRAEERVGVKISRPMESLPRKCGSVIQPVEKDTEMRWDDGMESAGRKSTG